MKEPIELESSVYVERLLTNPKRATNNIRFHSRLQKTKDLIKYNIGNHDTVLDLGGPNLMREMTFPKTMRVSGTMEIDLNDPHDYERIIGWKFNVITAFEVFEHIYNLYPLLVSKQYFDPTHEHRRHYNEFEEPQFRWIMGKAGWEIQRLEYWRYNFYPNKLRSYYPKSLIRLVYPSWIAGYAFRKQSVE